MSIEDEGYLCPWFPVAQGADRAVASGRWADAEREYLKALRMATKAGESWSFVNFRLADFYRKQGRVTDAMKVLEAALPMPAAFQRLQQIFRAELRDARKSRDRAAVEWGDRLLSLSRLHQQYALESPSQPYSPADCRGFQARLRQMRERSGSIYPLRYADAGAIENDGFLSDRDYQMIHRANFE